MLWTLEENTGAAGPPPSGIAASPGFQAWEKDLADRGVEHRGQRLRPPADAVTVRVRAGEVVVTDGPFVDTTEHIGGYEIVDATDLDQAIEVATRHPACRVGVEIRPFHTQEHGPDREQGR